MATTISRDILNKETNARFWAQTGYKPGQRLDPNNPLDKAKMPVWMDIFRKVNAEADVVTRSRRALLMPRSRTPLLRCTSTPRRRLRIRKRRDSTRKPPQSRRKSLRRS